MLFISQNIDFANFPDKTIPAQSIDFTTVLKKYTSNSITLPSGYDRYKISCFIDSPATSSDGGIGIRIDGVGSGTPWRSRIFALSDGTLKADNVQAPQVFVFSGGYIKKIATKMSADITLSLQGDKIRGTIMARASGGFFTGTGSFEASKSDNIVLSGYRDNGSVSNSLWLVECQKFN